MQRLQSAHYRDLAANETTLLYLLHAAMQQAASNSTAPTQYCTSCTNSTAAQASPSRALTASSQSASVDSSQLPGHAGSVSSYTAISSNTSSSSNSSSSSSSSQGGLSLESSEVPTHMVEAAPSAHATVQEIICVLEPLSDKMKRRMAALYQVHVTLKLLPTYL